MLFFAIYRRLSRFAWNWPDAGGVSEIAHRETMGAVIRQSGWPGMGRSIASCLPQPDHEQDVIRNQKQAKLRNNGISGAD
jgi:hypothetical protein